MVLGDMVSSIIPNVTYVILHVLALVVAAYTSVLTAQAKWGVVSKLLMLVALAEFFLVLSDISLISVPVAELVSTVLVVLGVLMITMEASAAAIKAKVKK